MMSVHIVCSQGGQNHRTGILTGITWLNQRGRTLFPKSLCWIMFSLKNGNPLQYSCLENPMDRGAWQATVHGVAGSWTCLSDYHSIEHLNCCCACLHQSCLTLCDPMDCKPPGPSVHGILQASILEWVAIPFSRGSSWFKDWEPGSLALQADSALLRSLSEPPAPYTHI